MTTIRSFLGRKDAVRRGNGNDQRRCDPNAAVWRAVLPGSSDRRRHRQARSLRGAELRGIGPAARSWRQEEAALEGELGPPRTPHRVEREGLPAPDYPAKDRRTRPVLRAMPTGAGPSLDPRRRDHLVRRKVDVRARGRRFIGRPSQGAGARRHPARN